MATVRQYEVEVGEALVIGVETDFDITGATVAARISVNGAAAVDVVGALDAAVDGAIKGGEVDLDGALFTVPTGASTGYAEGVVTITSVGEPWSPSKVRFNARIYKVP